MRERSREHRNSLKQLIVRPLMDDFPIDREANQLALQACAQAARTLGWPNKTNLSEAEIEILRRKSEEKAIELRDQISDPAKRPRLAALRKAIKGCIFFEDEVQAAELDRAWFSKNDDHRFRVRAALPHESEPHHRSAYRSIAIVLREPDGEGEYNPVLVCVTRVNHAVDWENDDEIERVINWWSSREIAPLH